MVGDVMSGFETWDRQSERCPVTGHADVFLLEVLLVVGLTV